MVPAIWARNAPVYLVTYAQALFAKAEAAKLGRIAGGDAEVEGSYNQASNSRCNNERIVLQAQQIFSTRKVCRITQTQCWVHLFMYGYEGWAERRHTGNPANMVDPDGKEVPTRHSYRDNEAFNNTSSYKEALQRQFGGQNSLYGHAKWDK